MELEEFKDGLSNILEDDILLMLREIKLASLSESTKKDAFMLVLMLKEFGFKSEAATSDSITLISLICKKEIIQRDDYGLLIKDFITLIKTQDSSSFIKVRIILKMIDRLGISDYEYINRIKNADIDYINLVLIDKLIEIDMDENKRMLAINHLITNRVVCNNVDLSELLHFITSNLVLGYSDLVYKQILCLSFKDLVIPLCNAFSNNLDDNKRVILISYYYGLLTRYLGSDVYFRKGDFETDVFTVGLNENLVNCDSQKYSEMLNRILNSGHPMAYAKIVNSAIDEDKKDIACALIDDKKPVMLNSKDTKDEVSEAATLGVLPNIDDELYQHYLNIINEMESKVHSTEDGDLKRLYYAKLNALLSMFTKGVFYKSNMDRLEEVTSIILSSNDAYAILEIGYFASHVNSKYYSDQEFDRAISILSDSHETNNCMYLLQCRYFYLKHLLTNNSIPYMDRNKLMDKIGEMDKKEISDLIVELNNADNKNISSLISDFIDNEFQR